MKLDRYVILSDIHVPFHDQKLMLKVSQLIYELKPKGVILNGDVLDMYTLASFNHDSVNKLRDLTLDMEYTQGNLLLSALDEAMPAGCEKHFLYGNHEDRYFREVDRGDRGKYGTALQSPTEALRLRERGYHVEENYRQGFVRLGTHLEVTHGNFTTINAAKAHLDAYQGSVLVGHTHRLNTFVTGKRGAWNVGFLGDPTSAGFHYESRISRDRWTQALAVVSVSGSGDFWVEVIQVHNGIFTYNGKVY
jgi:predicted phosphodiesterase